MKKILFPLLMAATMANAQEDPYMWLEDVTGDKSIAWVKEQNARSQPLLEASPVYKELHDRFLSIYTSRERIPTVTKRGDYLYNYWQDATYPRGIIRRTSMAEYRKKDPAWETVLDITKLSADEKQPWVYKGVTCLYPEYRRCLVSLSRGGADAVEVREFDAVTKAFVKDGFFTPESKGGVAWRDADTLYVSRDFGPGTMTKSGYPRQVREWKRGTPLAQAKVVFEAKEDDVGAGAGVINEPGRQYEVIRRSISVRYGEDFIRQGDKWVMLETPKDAEVSTFNGMLVARLRSDWEVGGRKFKAGSLVSTDLDKFLAGGRQFDLVFEPTPRVSLQAYTVTKNYLVLDVLDNVKGRVIEARRDGSKWALREVKVPPAASIGLSALDRDTSDEYWMTVTSFLEPTTRYLGKAGSDDREKLKFLPAFFDAK